MIKPILYDMRKTLTSKSILILMILLVLMGLVVVSQLIPNGAGQIITSPGTQMLSYYNANGTYTFLGLSWNQFGQGVSGTSFHLSLNNSRVTYSGAGTTSGDGETIFRINAPVNVNYSIVYETSTLSAGGTGGEVEPYQSSNGGTFTEVPPGQVVSLQGSVILPVTNPYNASQMKIQTIWAGANGSNPVNYAVYYKIGNDLLSPYSLQESDMQLLGTMSNIRQAFSLPNLNSSTIANSTNLMMYFVLFNPNGTATSQAVAFPLTQLYPPPAPPLTSTRANSVLAGFFQSLFGIFIPLVAILGSYIGYGKDRLSGVLESVLSQPVSRLGISLSRFFSIFGALAIATTVAVLLLDAMVFYFTGGLASSTLVASAILAFFVELAAFTGIMMFLSRIFKSSAALVGLGIGLFMLIDFFWGLIISLVARASSTGYNTSTYGQLVITAQFINPAQFVSLANTYLTHVATFVGLSPFSLTMTPSTYGISVLTLAIDAVIWIAVPLAAFLYLSTRRD